MATINQIKQLAETDTPLLLFRCIMPDGSLQCWSTHHLILINESYAARVLKHNLFELQLSADDAMDGISQLSITLANADSVLSELNRGIGFKGSQLTVYFVFSDLTSGTITSESAVLFRGVAGDPDEIAEDSLRLTFTNKLSLQRIPVPEVRVQRACPWNFPTNLAQRTEAKDGAEQGRFSRFYRCGYSADVAGGLGNLNGNVAFQSCDGSRGQCEQRGMFRSDSAGNPTSRFGGFEFVPSAILVRTSGDKTSHVSPLLDNSAVYNDPVPLVYGTGWLKSPVVFARNDGNLTHMEVLIGMGVVDGVMKVVVNDVEIPVAVQGTDTTATGWYSVVTTGTRNGAFNRDFADALGNPLGDPYGSISTLSVVVPNRISSGKSLPKVEVLLRGMQIDLYNSEGTFRGTAFSDNPAWIILDILRRCGWSLSETNIASFAAAAQFCDTLITSTDLHGNPLQVPRYRCNLILAKRQSAASVIRGIRVGSALMLRYGVSGLLELLPETTISQQQPVLPDGSNSTEQLQGGWPSYEFSDHSGTASGIARDSHGGSSVRLVSRTVAETSNRLSVEFQDETNEYQQDSLSVVDADDSALIGYEVSSQSTALGIANANQATRVLLRQLDKSTRGNLYVEFQTSFRALKIRPGDIIALTYEKEGLSRVPFRVTKLSPSLNYEMVTVAAQIHSDEWYSDDPSVLAGVGRQPNSTMTTPRPLVGTIPHLDTHGAATYFDFGVQEKLAAKSDATATDILTVSFTAPRTPSRTSPALPLLGLSPQYLSTGGTLEGGSNWYYAVSAVDASGNEGALSFVVQASIPQGSDENCVSLVGLSFPKTASTFNVYRGLTPQSLLGIATGVPLSQTYTDTGASLQPMGPPDPNFAHANFYYRYEFAGPYIVSSASASTLACADMGAVPLAYGGMTVRVIAGTGKGQERLITSNDPTTISVSPGWTTIPDSTTEFVIAENSWHPAAVATSSPARFELLYQKGQVIHITGRGANSHNSEGAGELCPITRFALGSQAVDSGVAKVPDFTLEVPGAGALTLSQVGFDDLTNTGSVSSGTLQLFAWNELLSQNSYLLAQPAGVADSSVTLASAGTAHPGSVIQVGQELMIVLSNLSANVYQVARAALGSAAGVHNAGDAVLHLASTTLVVPFAMNFFQNRASMNFLHSVKLPDLRVAAAQFFVTNAFGDSQARTTCYTTLSEGGLRTLSGGQFSLQVSGVVATQQNAAPPLVIEASHAVRDMRATLNQAASGYSIAIALLQNGTPYCNLLIAPGSTVSNVVNGGVLPALTEGASLSVNVTLNAIQGYAGGVNPGRDLSVTIRL